MRTTLPNAYRMVALCTSLAIFTTLVACGGGHSSNTPGGNFGSGAGGSGGGGGNFGSGSNGGGGTGGNFGNGGGTNTGTITGRVIDSSTSQPISGSVAVALESEAGSNFTVVAQTAPDAQGNFTFSNVASGNFALAVSALSTRQVPFVPVVLVSGGASAAFTGGQNITPGTNVGTIPVPEAPPTTTTPFGSGPAALLQTFVQTDIVTPVKLTFDVSEQIDNSFFPIPFSLGAPTAVTATGTACTSAGCATTTFAVAPWTPMIGVFNGANTQFQPSTFAANYAVTVNAFAASTNLPDCAPSSQTSTQVTVNPGQTVVVPSFNFSGCQ